MIWLAYIRICIEGGVGRRSERDKRKRDMYSLSLSLSLSLSRVNM